MDDYSTTLLVLLNGNQASSQTLSLPFGDPTVQAAVSQAEAMLSGKGASFGAPRLTSNTSALQSSVTTPQTYTGNCSTYSAGMVPYGTTSTVSFATTTYIGPQTIMIGNCQTQAFNIAAGAEDIDTVVTSTLNVPPLTINTYLISQTYQLSGVTGAALAITATPAYQEVKGGDPATYTLNLTSQGGFTGSVDLACAGLPAGATCSFSENPIAVAAGETVQATVTITTTAANAAVRKPRSSGGWNLLVFGAFAPFNLSGLAALLAGCFKRRRRPTDARLIRVLCILAIVFLVIGLSSCGCPSTRHQTYTISITGTSAGTGTPIATSVALAVK